MRVLLLTPAFYSIVNQIIQFDVAQLSSIEEKLVFYINAYNILTIRLILDNWPIDSIRDIGNFFKGPWMWSYWKIQMAN